MRPVDVLVIDYGVYPLPRETARSYDRVPKRKDGEPAVEPWSLDR